MRIGLHLTSFLARGGRAGIAAMLARVAERAEQAGLHSIWPMDQLRQLERFGDPDEPMLEAYTVLGWIAGRTERVQLGALVTGGPYRNPERLLQSVETLDTVSGGRAWLGLGAGWDDDFYARAREQHPRILIGGGGERRTLRLVARYADACNVFEREDVARKLAVLREHCEAERRPYHAILKTTFGASSRAILSASSVLPSLAWTSRSSICPTNVTWRTWRSWPLGSVHRRRRPAPDPRRRPGPRSPMPDNATIAATDVDTCRHPAAEPMFILVDGRREQPAGRKPPTAYDVVGFELARPGDVDNASERLFENAPG